MEKGKKQVTSKESSRENGTLGEEETQSKGITKFQTTDKKIERLTLKEKYEIKELKRVW